MQAAEFNSTVAAAAGDATRTLHFLGCLLTLRAGAADTGGGFSIIDCLAAPGAGAPPHRQADVEAFLVKEGHFEFMVDGKARLCGPDDFVHVPAGAVHMFRNADETPSRMLIINLPGGPHEAFFRAAGEPVASEDAGFPPMTPPDVPMLVATAARFGIEILPPGAA